jgi:hypothetical protein
MPNWCDNFISITGDKDKLDMIKHIIKNCAETKQGVFVSLVGLPPDITPENYEQKWYDAHIAWWGCKWDVFYDDNGCWNLDDDDEISASFDTAWSPPERFCEKLAQIFEVVVRVEFSEPGMGFVGFSVFDKEGVLAEETYDDYMKGLYNINRDQFWNEVEYRLDSWSDDEIDNEDFDLDKNLEEEFSFCTKEEKEQIKQDFIDNYKTQKKDGQEA